MNTTEQAEQLKQIIYRYYPRNIDLWEEQPYESSPEQTRLRNEKPRLEGSLVPKWQELKAAIERAFPNQTQWDTSYLRADNCFRLRLYSPKATCLPNVVHADALATVLLVSILTPVHCLYSACERAAHGEYLEPWVSYDSLPMNHAEETALDSFCALTFGSVRLPKEILSVPVPDAAVLNTPLGQAVLADFLFTDDRK